MKKFAGIDLEVYDLTALKPQEMRSIKCAFLEYYQYISTHSCHCTKALHVNKHLNQYLYLSNFSTWSADQIMAMVIGNLPDAPPRDAKNTDFMLICYLKEVLKDCDYQGQELSERQKIISQKKNILNIAGDWKNSVMQFREAVTIACLDVAYANLDEISNITRELNQHTSEYAEYLLGVQIVNYISVLEFLRSKVEWFNLSNKSAEWGKLNNEVYNRLQVSFNKLLKVLGPPACNNKQSFLRGLFFSSGEPISGVNAVIEKIRNSLNV